MEEEKRGQLQLDFSQFTCMPIDYDKGKPETKGKFDAIGKVLLRKMHEFDAASERPESRKDEGGIKTLDPMQIKFFFSEWRHALYQEATEAVEQDESTKQHREQEQAWLVRVEQQFNQWLTIDNPIGKLEADLRRRHCTKATIKEYLNCGRQYMKYCNYDPKFDQEEVLGYIDSLEKKGWKALSVNNHKIVLRCWLDILGRPSPFPKRPDRGTKVTTRIKSAPSLKKEAVIKLIGLVKKHGTAQEKFILALCTTWAPRRQEICNIHNGVESIFEWDSDEGFLKFQPMKHNFERYHLVPSQVMPYLRDYKREKDISESKVGRLFTQMCRRYGFELPTKEDKLPREKRGSVRNRRLFTNTHALRHSLQTELQDRKVDKSTIETWFGYASRHDMPSYYYSWDSEKLLKIDGEILKKHPFIKAWGD
jgi:hypothetical protein